MKKLILATCMLFAFTMTFAQNDNNSFKKNEISLAPYTSKFVYYNSNGSGEWQRDLLKYEILNTNYRRFLNENTALRFGGRVGFGVSGNDGFSLYDVEVRAGLEKYLTLSPRFQLYGGALLNLSSYGLSMNDFNAHSVGVDFIGGVRYNINDKWSLSSEIISPIKYGWSSRGASVWETGVKWQALKFNFRF